MTAAADFLADAAKRTVAFDNFGRYVLPDPTTGEDRPWTRATTFAGAVKDTFGLNRWSLRMLAKGLTARADLVAAIAANYDDDRTIDKVVADAQEHAGSTTGSTWGTAMHRFTEFIDQGEEPLIVPPEVQGDLDAYRKVMARFTSFAIERIVCVPELGVAGTLDRVLDFNGTAYIGDLKTGKDLRYSAGEIAVQLALYANAAFMWNGADWEPMPPVDRERAIVMHLPVGQGRCDLQWVDIAAGWRIAQELCGPVREWRNRRDLMTPLDLSSPPPTPRGNGVESESAATAAPIGPVPDVANPPGDDVTPAGDRAGWITGRLQALAGNERARTMIGLRWPTGVTVKPPWTTDAITALAAMLDGVEAEVGEGFGATDPEVAQAIAENIAEAAQEDEPVEHVPSWDVTDDGVVASDEDVAGLAAVVGALELAQRGLLRTWARDAVRLGRSWDSKPMTQRQWSCSRAAISCVRHLGDEDKTRAALINVLDGRWGANWTIGAVIGSLSSAQAERLADLADAYGGGDLGAIAPF